MNELQIFNNAEFGSVRTLEKNGKILFCGKDVALALGYSNTKDAISRHCKGVVKHDFLTNGGIQEMVFISEGDLYRLAARSKLPKVERFERWIFDEVIPSIYKYGAYMTEQTIEKALFNPDFLIELATQLKNEQARSKQLETTVAVQEQQIAELKPRADYTDKILQNKGLVTITQIAKDYGMSGNKLNEKLHELGIQYKQSSQWLLYAKYQDKGYTHSETVNITRSDGRPDIKMNTKWTQKGRLFLYNLLKSNDILPTIEKNMAC